MAPESIDWVPDRRRVPRVDLLADLEGHLVTLDERVQVKQISPAGMTVETSAPLSPRVNHEFRLVIGERSVLVCARVIHSRVKVHHDTVSYLAGVEFVDPAPEAIAVVRELIRTLQP